MRTTISINDALLQELRQRAAQSGRPFRAVLEETLARGLRQGPAPRKPYKIRPHPLRLKPGFRNLSLNQLYDQLETESALRKL